MSLADRPRVGVIGAGWGAKLHLEGFKRTGRVDLVALTSRTRGTAEKLATEYGVDSVVDTLDELIDAVDVVSVATPPQAHEEAVLRAAAAGRHVLCDKPMALDSEASEAMLRAVREHRVHHATGFIWRLDPAFTHIRRLLAEGVVGRPLHVSTTCTMGVPVLPFTWMYEERHGGGALMQHGTHVLDRVRYLLGEEFSRLMGRLHRDVTVAERGPRFHNVLDAFAYAGDSGGRRVEEGVPVTVDTGYEILGETGSGTRLSFLESWHSAGGRSDHVEIHGEEATLEWAGGVVRLLGAGREPEDITVEGSSTSGANTPREHGLRMWHRLADLFLDDIQGGADGALPTLDDGHQVMRVVDAVRRSDKSEHWESV